MTETGHGGGAATPSAGGCGRHGEKCRENIWKMQGLMFWCSANCCEDNQASLQQGHQCIEGCHAPLAQAQALVTSELERFQDRLARCTMHCNDKVKDSIDAGNKELQVK